MSKFSEDPIFERGEYFVRLGEVIDIMENNATGDGVIMEPRKGYCVVNRSTGVEEFQVFMLAQAVMACMDLDTKLTEAYDTAQRLASKDSFTVVS